MVIFKAEKGIFSTFGSKASIPYKVLVVGRVNGVLIVAEFEREEGIFAPRNIRVDLDLFAVLREMGVSFSSQ